LDTMADFREYKQIMEMGEDEVLYLSDGKMTKMKIPRRAETLRDAVLRDLAEKWLRDDMERMRNVINMEIAISDIALEFEDLWKARTALCMGLEDRMHLLRIGYQFHNKLFYWFENNGIWRWVFGRTILQAQSGTFVGKLIGMEQTKQEIVRDLDKTAEKITEAVDKANATAVNCVTAVTLAADKNMDRLEKISKDTTKTMAQELKALRKEGIRVSSIDDAMKQIGTMYEQIKGIATLQAPEALRSLETVIGLMSATWAYFRSTQTDVKVAILLSVTTLTHAASTMATEVATLFGFIDWAKEWMNSLRAQAGDELTVDEREKTENLFFAIIPMIGRAFGYTTFEQRALDAKRIAQLGSYLKVLKHTKDVYSFLLKYITSGFEWIYEQIYQIPYNPDEHLMELLSTYIIEVEQLTQGDVLEQSRTDRTIIEKVQKVADRGAELLKRGFDSDVVRRNLPTFMATYREVKKLNNRLQMELRGEANRHRPVFLRLLGIPGVGKSDVARDFSAVFLRATGREYNKSAIWWIAQDDEYQD